MTKFSLTFKMWYRFIWIPALFIFLHGCKQESDCIDAPDISGINLDISITRIDQLVRNAENHDQLKNILTGFPVFSEEFLGRSGYPSDSILTEQYLQLLRDPYIDTLFMETDRVFGDLKELKDDFETAFRILKSYFPEFQPPSIQTVVTGMAHDMYLSDTLIIIGLDFYLGEGAKFRPLEMPGYILKRYQKRNVVPNTLLFYSSYFIKNDPDDQSLLADMVYYGKAYQFTKQLMPCIPDSVLLGYDPEEMKSIGKGREIIWANFIENEALYETDRHIKDRFIAERPKTFEIGQNCPGRIGRWVGWEIVKSYIRNNPGVSFAELLGTRESQEIFIKSRYKPRND